MSQKLLTVPGAMIELQDAMGNCLSVGVCAEGCVLIWVGSSGEPPYFSSRGTGSFHDTVAFLVDGARTDFPGDRLVSYNAAVKAVECFARSGERTKCVTWAED